MKAVLVTKLKFEADGEIQPDFASAAEKEVANFFFTANGFMSVDTNEAAEIVLRKWNELKALMEQIERFRLMDNASSEFFKAEEYHG